MNRKILALAGVAGVACAMSAKTVALWTLMDAESRVNMQTPTVNGRDAFGRYDLTVPSEGVAATARCGDWEQPPNPDTDPDRLLLGANTGAYKLQDAARYLRNDPVGLNHLSLDRDFTLEGWINIPNLPAANNWFYVAGMVPDGNAGGVRTILSLRNNSGGVNGYSWQVFTANGDRNLFAYGTDEAGRAASEELLNAWHHVALTYRRDDGGQSSWKFYLDGAFKGEARHAPVTARPVTNGFFLGGRGDHGTCAGFDYWRISDAALEPEQFLNAVNSDAGTPCETVAYWPMGRLADGTPDPRDAVGATELSSGVGDLGANRGAFTPNRMSEVVPSPVGAFTGNPPNGTLPGGNAGSMLGVSKVSTCLVAPGLGSSLDATNSFTVEGWFQQERRFGDASLALKDNAGSYLFNTRRPGGKGWALQLWGVGPDNDRTMRLGLYVHNVHSEITLGEDLRLDTGWHHVALTRDLAEGNGTWNVYLDGKLLKKIADPSATYVSLEEPDFHLGGRMGNDHDFQGRLDCVRVSRVALAPEQFLNATEGARSVPDEDVLAFWPLDAKGFALDGRDLRGAYHLTAEPVGAALHPRASESAPEIANPDASAAFRGDPAASNGSFAFNDDGAHASSYAAIMSAALNKVLQEADAYTFECYVYRTAAVNGTWELIFGECLQNGMGVNFTYRSNGFVLFDNKRSNVNDAQFPQSTPNDLPVGKWAHLAYTFRKTASGARYELFVDGVSKGVIESGVVKAGGSPNVLIGGRPWSGNAFKGRIAHVRISRGARTPEEFLCAASGWTPPAHRTWAFWPVDATGTTFDLADRVDGRFGLKRGAPYCSAPVVAAVPGARPSVPNPDASESFVGDPKANASAVELKSGQLAAQNIGLLADPGRPFTVEGWLKWSPTAGAANEMVCGTWALTSKAGWKLQIDKSGEKPELGVFARGYGVPTPLVQGTFGVDVSGWADVWHHVALVCDPYAGDTGEWRLLVDGKPAGAPVKNVWRPCNGLLATQIFLFGSYTDGPTPEEVSCLGAYDMWRVSSGALTADELLFRPPAGATIFVR